jgi:hypothetical protein
MRKSPICALPIHWNALWQPNPLSLSKGPFGGTARVNSVLFTRMTNLYPHRSPGRARGRFRWTADGCTPLFLMRRAACGMLVASDLLILPRTSFYLYLGCRRASQHRHRYRRRPFGCGRAQPISLGASSLPQRFKDIPPLLLKLITNVLNGVTSLQALPRLFPESLIPARGILR